DSTRVSPPGAPTQLVAPPSAAIASVNDALAAELRNLRHILESRLPRPGRESSAAARSIHATLQVDLARLGLAGDLAAQLIEQLPQDTETARALPAALHALTSRISTLDERWLERGGRLMFVGPSGVGKTTLLAQLAARWIGRGDGRRIALVSTDVTRIGAREQLQVFGSLLGARIESVDHPRELADTLRSLAEYELVLIDTGGVRVHDDQSYKSLASWRSASSSIDTVLVAPASAQPRVLDELFARCASLTPSACVLTRLDEAASLGAVLSAAIRASLPVAYVSTGPGIPRDLLPARQADLVGRAYRLACVDLAGSDGYQPASEGRAGVEHVAA
ncbi:MAG: AAA family ATPase, partial [Pseudomonadales bacterium]|nr:AAA family ATPase [Pseudomonadales bacterium]